MLKRVFAVLTVAVLLTSAVATWAQTSTSSITGVVTDSTGAVVSGAKVQAKNEATGVAYDAATSSAGVYNFSSLTPGPYTIAVSQTGFQTFSSVHNVLTVGVPLVVDAQLKVGAEGQTVQVESTYERIETTNAAISDVVTEKQVKNLPLNGRNPLTLLTLEPGVVQRTVNSAGSGTHVFGSRDRSHNVTIDGIDANESTVPSPTSNIQRLNPDNVQEFRTVTLGATAENGRNSGANVMIATKAGTNAIHGDLFEFLRNDALNANEWFNQNAGQPVPKLNLNQFGFDVGGPLIKNKTFWFGSFQHNIIKQSAPISAVFGTPRVYTPSLRSGIFRYVKGSVTTASGFTTDHNDKQLVDARGNLVAGVRACASASDNNCIASYNINAANDPRGLGIDPKMLAVANSLPAANAYGSAGDGLNNAGFLWNPPTKFTGPNVLVRVDHNFGPNDNIFVRWLQNHYNTAEGDFINARPMVYPGFPPLGEVNRLGKNLAISYRHTFSPNLVNEFTMGFNRFAFVFTFGESNPDFPDFTKDLNYADSCIYGSLGLVDGPYCVSGHTARGITTPQFIDNLSWIKGSHTIRMGLNFRFYIHNDSRGFFGSTVTNPGVFFSAGGNANTSSQRVPNWLNVPTSGINSTDLTNLNQAIDELAGIPSAVVKSFVADFNGNQYAALPLASVHTRAHQYDTYVQDEWKVKPNVTLNYGLRWEYNPAPFDAVQTLQTDKFIDGSAGLVTFQKSDKWFKNDNPLSLAPRVGIAWSPDGKTSVRAGYALLFDVLSTFQVTAIAGKVPGFMQLCSTTIDSTNNLSTTAGCVAPSAATLANLRINTGFPLDVPAPTVKPSAALTVPVQSRGTAPSVGAFDPNMKNPAVHEWNLTIQRELPLHFVAEVGYIGKRGTHLYRAYDLNQIDPVKIPGFLDSFNIAHNNVVKGCTPSGTGCPTGVTGQTPTFLLSLVNSTFMNSSTSVTDFRRNSIGNVAARMDNLAANSSQRVGLPLNFFRPNSQFNQIFFQDSGGDSYYHGLYVAARRRFEQGLTFGISYTFSKSIDDMSVDPTGASTGGGLSTTNSRTPTDVHNFRLDRAVSDFDNRHVIASSMLYEFPFGRNKKFAGNVPTWLNYVIGGWSMTHIFNYQSGEPFTINSGVFTVNSTHVSTAVMTGDQPGTHIIYNVPNVTGPVLYTTGGIINSITSPNLNCQLLTSDNTKFCIPAAGQNGAGRNTVRGPGFWNLDSGLMKNFAVTERFNLQFRAEAFNVLNHPNFDNPRNATTGSPTITSSVFGQLCCGTAAVGSSSQVNPIGEPMRVLQLSLKLNF